MLWAEHSERISVDCHRQRPIVGRPYTGLLSTVGLGQEHQTNLPTVAVA